MTTVNTYLTFDGNCEAAFLFYKSIFGGEFSYIGRFGDMPPQDDLPTVPDEMKNRIMHVSLPISTETMLMGSDTGGEWSSNLVKGNNFSISVNTESKAEAERVFNALAVGGEVTMPLAMTFWQAYFGMLTDRFGISWMISYDLSREGGHRA
ncbi:MAG: VOC family protein [Saprospiraceae bacterium]|nr:VOC family protein [Saprospiraceae bacterium]